MKEITVSAICTGGEDYKEADKLVKLITAGSGVMNVLMKGVKKEKAKLKFAAMPFSFCEYTLLNAGGFYTVKNAVPQESLFDIAEDPDSYVCGSIMLETAAIAMGGECAPDIFVFLLRALKLLIFSDIDAYSLTLNFVFRLLVRGGHYAADEKNADYDCEISVQESLVRASAISVAKKFLRVFEEKYCCKIKSSMFL